MPEPEIAYENETPIVSIEEAIPFLKHRRPDQMECRIEPAPDGGMHIVGTVIQGWPERVGATKYFRLAPEVFDELKSSGYIEPAYSGELAGRNVWGAGGKAQ